MERKRKGCQGDRASWEIVFQPLTYAGRKIAVIDLQSV